MFKNNTPATGPYGPQPVSRFSAMAPIGSKPGQWSTGLCDCSEDPKNCCLTCICPCITFAQNVEIIDRGTTPCVSAGSIYYVLAHACCSCLYTCTYRTRLRGLYGLHEEPCADWFLHFCCQSCAICQEYRELKNRGLDPSMGWIANVERLNQGKGGTTVPPTVAPSMSR